MKGSIYVPWYDNANISQVMFRYGFNCSDAIDYIWLYTSPFEKSRIASAIRAANSSVS